MSEASSEVPLVMEDVSFSYPNKGMPVPILHGVSLSSAAGEWVAIMGPSGSGKTTAMLCAAGLLRPHQGTVTLVGHDVLSSSERALTRLRRSQVGFIFQDFNLVPALSAAQNVELPSLFSGVRPKRERTLEILARVDMNDKASSLPDQLSGGQRQRVAIARAIISQPEIVFADEPTGSLDQRAGDQVLQELQKLVDDGTSVVMVTHDPRVAARAHRVVWLNDGRVVDEMRAPNAEDIATRLTTLRGE